MVSPTQFPDETWLEIFRYASRVTLPGLSLACKRFKCISRPLLFSHFDFHPYAIIHGGMLLPSRLDVLYALDRLEFWTSDGIAPHVRSCKISTWKLMDHPAAEWRSSYTDSAHILLDAFFNELTKFTGLETFHAENIHFTQSVVVNLCRAPAVVNVQLAGCAIACGEHIDISSLSLDVSHFTFIHDITTAAGIDLWIPLLRPERLRELYLVCNPRFFGENLAAIPSFPHVDKLTMTMDQSTMSYNLSILSKFAGLQIFSMYGWGDVQDGPGEPVDASAVLPVLRQYTGSGETLGLFLSRSTLTHLTIPYCKQRDFTTPVQVLGGPNYVTSLDVHFDTVDMATLETICSAFPKLSSLRIRIHTKVQEDEEFLSRSIAFFTELGDFANFPTGLERLAIAWKFEYKNSDEEPDCDDAEEPDYTVLCDGLEANCPSLTTFWLDGFSFLFHWHKVSDDSEDYCIVVDDDGLQTKRGEFDSFWATHLR
ncbi:hypothetical protein C8R45DRAFT_1208777 [Mycena sanguinolenta]|nr:hypothetical protein C8R45DRAFT_1208777 [Mycena sanguinolenta]